MKYTLNKQHLENYVRVLVHFALNGGQGIHPGESVYLTGNEVARPLYMKLYEEIVRSGGHVIHNYLPNEFDRFGVNRFLAEHGNNLQLNFQPLDYYKELVRTIDHHLVIISSQDPRALEGTSSESATAISNASVSGFFNERNKRESEGELSWTMALYGTAGMAREAGISEKEYWRQIIKACYLDHEDPVARWRQVQKELEQVRTTLTEMKIRKMRIIAKDTDLTVPIGSNRKWLGGSGRNMPSFEVFTTPDWRGVQGYVSYSEPLLYLGKRISGIRLEFDGAVTAASATENESTLKALLAVEDADKLGETSLTDSRHSEISCFMATTLYDENTGGSGKGNNHNAVGRCFHEAFTGDRTNMSNDYMHTELGFNKCTKLHVDMISTSDRTVIAELEDGGERVIYEKGMFTFLKK